MLHIEQLDTLQQKRVSSTSEIPSQKLYSDISRVRVCRSTGRCRLKVSRAESTPDGVKAVLSYARQKHSSSDQSQQRAPIRTPTKLPKEPPTTLPLTAENLLSFERHGHLTTRRLLSQNAVQKVRRVAEKVVEEQKLDALKHRLRVLCPQADPARVRTVQHAELLLSRDAAEPVGFLQVFNTWRWSTDVQEEICGGTLAQTAACLLGSRKVRLYQDCIFVKEPGFARTNWHSDLRMAPFDTNNLVTAWIPLRPIKNSHDSGLIFASGSHRDFALPFWRKGDLENLDLTSRDYPMEKTGAMELGDVSWHSGWTLHCSPAQPRGSPARLALSVSYFADGAKLLPAKFARSIQSEDRESYAPWLKKLKAGSKAEHSLLPLVDTSF